MQKKALIAMSGGVDSSVAAYLMIQKGYDCAGATMKLYDNPQCSQPGQRACCTPSDTEDARNVAALLCISHAGGIPQKRDRQIHFYLSERRNT